MSQLPPLSRAGALAGAFKQGYYDLLGLSPKQQEALRLLSDSETAALAFGGGANGGKSWLGCAWLIIMCMAYPGTSWFIGREELNRLMQSTFLTFYKVAAQLGLGPDDFRFNAQRNYFKFTNGSRIQLLELVHKPSDPLYERYGSVEFTGGWIEEGGEVNFAAYDTLKSRVGRQLNDKYNLRGRILITCNPKKNWLYTMFYKPSSKAALPPRLKFLQSLVTDNPNRESGAIEALEGLTDESKRQRLLYGNWEYDDDPTALVPYEYVVQLPNNTHALGGLPAITVDVARYGSDKTVIWGWDGWRAKLLQVLKGASVPESAEAVKKHMRERQCPPKRVVVDDDGVGGGVRDLIPGSVGFIANSRPRADPKAEKVLDPKTGNLVAVPENYDNLKSQCKFRMAARMVAGSVLIENPGAEAWELVSDEISQWKRQDGEDGKMAAVSKDDEKQALGRSPDYADPLYMREILELLPPAPTRARARW
ncbi:phage portal protein [Hymenobacter sp. BT18]|uniref:phage terminase large subunit n=1 Tax=Hymenobacter sp. BT18 TaxID=2835648 RepID=UPI00143E4102|nr:phage terminase large subunit [Hymenobacter sp. BT18]QIX61850.1 phage portal protein [Hymenobacter sp. BT18]